MKYPYRKTTTHWVIVQHQTSWIDLSASGLGLHSFGFCGFTAFAQLVWRLTVQIIHILTGFEFCSKMEEIRKNLKVFWKVYCNQKRGGRKILSVGLFLFVEKKNHTIFSIFFSMSPKHSFVTYRKHLNRYFNMQEWPKLEFSNLHSES